MSTDIVNEIAARTATLPVEQQQQVLRLVKTLALQRNALPRRSVFGDLEQLGVRVTEEDIEEARREMWRGYIWNDE